MKKSNLALSIISCLVVGSLVGCMATTKHHNTTAASLATTNKQTSIDLWPQPKSLVKPDPKIEAAVKDLISQLTLEQKVAQMIQPELRSVTVADMKKYGFGSILNGGGSFPNGNKHATTEDWVNTADAFYLASIDDTQDGTTVPSIWGTDAVHGHNNVIGATLFPHNIGLGAANNPELIKQVAEVIAREVAQTGIDWDFSPTVAVARDDRWGRAYESFSEDPAIVKAYAGKYVEGIQGVANDTFLNNQHILATAKHFVGDGGTDKGVDQGNNLSTEKELIEIHAQGYVSAIEAGVQSIMASFNSWHGDKLHGHQYLLTDVLKGRMGFDGLVVGDWNGHGQVKGCDNKQCAQAINAGVDIIMVPEDWKAFYENTLIQVKQGEISHARIDDAVTRILRVKMRLGAFDGKPSIRLHQHNKNVIGSAQHRAIARQSVRESLVLLKNNNNLLPLNPTANILMAGNGANNIGKQNGGWTITWQGTGNDNSDFPNGSSIYQGIAEAVKQAGGHVELNEMGDYTKKPDVAIVVFGEDPYAEMQGDIKSGSFEYQMITKRDLALLKKLKAQNIPVVSLFLSGRPLWANKEINASDAFVAAWLPGTEGAGIADVILRKANGDINHDFKGKLSFSWPMTPHVTPLNAPANNNKANYNPLFKLGYGLDYNRVVMTPRLPETFDDMPMLSTDADLTIFNQAPKLGFNLYLSDQNNKQRVSSSQATLANSKAISFSTQNRFVQEDALQLTWQGNQSAAMTIWQETPINIAAYNDSGKGSVSFDVNLTDPVTGKIEFAMQKQDQPIKTVDLTALLSKFELNSWHNINIDLACFTTAKNNNLVATVWSLTTASKNQLTVSNIKLTTQSKGIHYTCE
ncbi:glycoside hydrolase family 3 protein [Algibacillus agarilyticus]|uniref:glycoside hydrolase family 3 protein n=1 Tax=Algibacillus agarilyticus TaxID=2234133 RepID=UPI000DCFC760|nr:glycoside hydrolase family 3 N-terminal domain-containing protein [Algibacillus agarilyticus]